MESSIFLARLSNDAGEVLNKINSLKYLPYEKLTTHPAKDAWNIIEIIAHLNAYHSFYIPRVENALTTDCEKHHPSAPFKPGILGRYFATSILPKSNDYKKMKALKQMLPATNSDENVITVFTAQQQLLLGQITRSSAININKIKIAIPATSLIKINLGDTFSFVINHQKRHLQQIERIITAI